METDTNTATGTAEPVETQQPQPAQPEAAEPQPDPKAAVFAELGIDGIAIIGIYTVLYSVSKSPEILSLYFKVFNYKCLLIIWFNRILSMERFDGYFKKS